MLYMSEPIGQKRGNNYDYGQRQAALESARQAGYRSLTEAAKACNCSVVSAIVYRPWEYSELEEESFAEYDGW